MDAQAAATKNGVMPRACRNCRLRKVRCNRALPCSNCLTSGLTCQLSGKPTSIAHPKQEPNTFSDDYRKELDKRISAIEEAITSLRQQQSGSDGTPNSFKLARGTCTSIKPSAECHTELPEGESSFGQQALYASQVAELTTSEASQSPIVIQELANLRGMTQEPANETKTRDYLSRGKHETPSTDIELPPSHFVLRMLRSLREQRGVQCLLFTFYGIRDCVQVEDLCKRIYFPVEPLSAGEVTLFNGMISLILANLRLSEEPDVDPQDHSYFKSLCEKNFQDGAETYEVMAVPTSENAMILSLAMIHAQTKARLPLQWSLTSAAARHCLTLGYHREERVLQLPSLEAERVRRLFWHVYILDKNLSSRLGKTSTIQDYDVDVKPCSISSDPGRAPWDIAFISFVELARIQGQIYESLYTPAVTKLNAEERVKIVSKLELQLSEWYNVWTQLDVSRAYDYKSFHITFGPTNVIYFSILTLLHRGTTLSSSAHDISPSCFEAAYQGLKAHLTFYPTLTSSGPEASTSYAVWIFYYTSFTPFVVTFLHCIANSDLNDLKLLEEVLASLEKVGSAIEYAEKQFNLCKALYRTADAFINSQKTRNHHDPNSATTLCLPLQNPFHNNWSYFDSHFHFNQRNDEWEEIPDFNNTSFALDHQM